MNTHSSIKISQMSHTDRMAFKNKRRERLYGLNKDTPTHVAANLGQDHPDYGMSMEEHLAEKAQRKSEKSS